MSLCEFGIKIIDSIVGKKKVGPSVNNLLLLQKVSLWRCLFKSFISPFNVPNLLNATKARIPDSLLSRLNKTK
ncbi:MAG: hypothetical protein ACJA2N_000928 [Salibacteraceae bacterium]